MTVPPTRPPAAVPPPHGRKRLLVVCDANVSRGPCAAALLQRYLDADGWQVVSAGTDAIDGAPVSDTMRAAASERDIDLGGHRAVRVSADLLRSADLIIAMSHRESAKLLALEPAMQRRVRLLGGFDPHPRGCEMVRDGLAAGQEIPDPAGGGIELHRECCRRLELGVAQLARWLGRREASRSSPTPRLSAPALGVSRLR
jgi:protein-tyrosine phosphatase